MLGDCYAAAVVEQLSKKELMALDAAILYQDTPVTPNGNGHNGLTTLTNASTATGGGGGCGGGGGTTEFVMPEAVIVNEMNGGLTVLQGSGGGGGGGCAGSLVAATHGRLNGTGQAPSASSSLGRK